MIGASLLKPSYAEIIAASNEFSDYLAAHYRDRMSEPMPYDRGRIVALAACRDSHGEWSVCLPLDLGDDEVVEWIDLHAECVMTRGELIEYMASTDWQGFLRWIAGVDENGDLLQDEEELD